MQFKQYPSYKNSGVEWLGDVPDEWDIYPFWYLFNRKEITNKTQEQLLSVYLDRGVILHSEGGGMVHKPADNLEKYQLVEVNDFVMNNQQAWRGSVGVSPYRGIVSPAYLIFSFNKTLCEPKFFKYFLRDKGIVDQFMIASMSVGTIQRQVKGHLLKTIQLSIPSLIEQNTIANFLDTETARIDNLIAKQEKLIELFKENIIALAMSEQINGKGKLIRLCNIVEEIHRPTQLIETEEYVALGLYNRGRGLFHKPSTLGQDMGDSDFFYVNSGDLILSGQFAWEGAVAMASNTECGCVVSHRYPVLRGSLVNTEYLFALFMTDYGDYLLNDSSRGSAGRNKPLNTNILLKHKIRMPSKEVQEKIKTMLEQKLKLEIKVHEVIEKLKEYRSSIISHAVTGKIDVREFC